MNREQTHRVRLSMNSMTRWIPLFLLALIASCGIPSASCAAQADVETATEAVEEAAPSTEQNQAETESDTDENGEAKQEKNDPEAEPATEEDSAAKKPAENSEEKSEENPSKDDSSSEPEKMESETTDKAPVETEREQEVDPPKQTKKEDEKAETPPPKKEKYVIGATATLLEEQSELKFRARVDTGAKSCSLNFEKIKIEDESKKEDVVERMTENVGKVIHFEVKNGDDKTHIITSKIAGYVIIKNSNNDEGKRRYKVPLTFRWKSMKKEVLVTLNKRAHMDYPLLLGRNFLKDDFLVDVGLDTDDK